jgi:hypothetical protein
VLTASCSEREAYEPLRQVSPIIQIIHPHGGNSDSSCELLNVHVDEVRYTGEDMPEQVTHGGLSLAR